jgi:uncharacterized oxidoreductase
MKLASNTVLITGGATGIGFALAERFLAAGSDVVICGRRKDRLREAREKHPRIQTRVCDVAKDSDRVSLCNWAVREFPRLNVLINNAGIQRRVPLVDNEKWKLTRQEIAVNFEAPVHLSTMLLPHFVKQERPAIVNITSGLSFVPLALAPIYSATKAALHSFTLSLRHQLSGTPIEVIEIIPPAVNTELGGYGLHNFGAPLGEFTDAVMARLEAGDLEIPYGTAQESSRAGRELLDEMFKRLNSATI